MDQTRPCAYSTPVSLANEVVTEEGYSLSFYLRDSFGSVVILDPMLDYARWHPKSGPLNGGAPLRPFG
jgi:hypothetical protein